MTQTTTLETFVTRFAAGTTVTHLSSSGGYKMTYGEAVGILGKQYVTHLYRFPALADCVAGVRTLQADCASKGLVTRAEAYNTVAEAMEEADLGPEPPVDELHGQRPRDR